MSPSRRAIFLDRDGVINRRRPDHVKSWDEFEFLPGVVDALAELTLSSIPLIVITNQSAVGRGLLGDEVLSDIHERMAARILEGGGMLAAVYACPHLPDEGCGCRKPGIELFTRAAAELDIVLSGSAMIGDSVTDGIAARAAGCHAILVGGAESVAGCLAAPDLRAAAALARRLLAEGDGRC